MCMGQGYQGYYFTKEEHKEVGGSRCFGSSTDLDKDNRTLNVPVFVKR